MSVILVGLVDLVVIGCLGCLLWSLLGPEVGVARNQVGRLGDRRAGSHPRVSTPEANAWWRDDDCGPQRAASTESTGRTP